MKSSCQFQVIGINMNCPVCRALVQSGEQHECEWDGGVGTRRTWPIDKPKPKKRKATEGK